ncbi:hypothetical protein BC830DRAFT_1171428 [Chytriomyces sp. MP71]|nr:hypothetical protein BC830DRAFT_1171428 [Chytriomyces sp. MP71]
MSSNPTSDELQAAFDFLPSLIAALHKLSGDPTRAINLDALRPDSAEMGEFRTAIEAAKLKVVAAQQMVAAMPGIELTQQQQDAQLRECERELQEKREQLDKYRKLPIFSHSNS